MTLRDLFIGLVDTPLWMLAVYFVLALITTWVILFTGYAIKTLLTRDQS